MGKHITSQDVSNAIAGFQRAARAAGIIPEGVLLGWEAADMGSTVKVMFLNAEGQREAPDGLSLHGCYNKRTAWDRITAATAALDAAERARKARMGALADECSPQSIRALAGFYRYRGDEALKTAVQELLVELETLRDVRNPPFRADQARIIAEATGEEG